MLARTPASYTDYEGKLLFIFLKKRTRKLQHLTMIQLVLKYLTFHNLLYLLPSLIKLNQNKPNLTQTFPTDPDLISPQTHSTSLNHS